MVRSKRNISIFKTAIESRCFKRVRLWQIIIINFEDKKTTTNEMMLRFALALTVSAVSGTTLGNRLLGSVYEELFSGSGDDFWL